MSLCRTANLLEIHQGPSAWGGCPKGWKLLPDMNLEPSLMSFYRNENHYSLVYFLKETLSHSETKSHRVETSEFVLYAYNLRGERTVLAFCYLINVRANPPEIRFSPLLSLSLSSFLLCWQHSLIKLNTHILSLLLFEFWQMWTWTHTTFTQCKIENISILLENSPMPLSNHLPYSNFYHHKLVLPALELHTNKIIKYVFICVWLLVLNCYFWFIHSAGIKNLCLLIGKSYSIIKVFHNLFIHSLVDIANYFE